jgi:AAA15 family ATPase/GTPase
MIYSFGGRNFYSFREAFEVDFRVKPQASERDIFQTDARGQKSNAVMGVFGANASGKTHLLQAIGFLQWFILSSAQSKPEGQNWYTMFFRFRDPLDLVTELYIEFEMEGEHYRYDLRVDDKRVLFESLRVKKTRFAVLFERTWTGSEYEFKSHNFGQNASQIPQRQNASFISTALLLENSMAKQLNAFFSSCYGNVNYLGRSTTNDPHHPNLFDASRFFHENADQLEWVNHRLANFDLGLDSIAIETARLANKDGQEEEHLIPKGRHVHQGKTYTLNLIEESRGTQALFVLLRHLLPVLKSGGIAFVDEIEESLHSHMIPCLVDLFYTPKHNPKGAQLIFTCHSDYIISHLEKYQIQLVDKDDEGVSHSYRLDDVKGVRNVDNLYAKYHAGAYGGIPDF